MKDEEMIERIFNIWVNKYGYAAAAIYFKQLMAFDDKKTMLEIIERDLRDFDREMESGIL
jgi:hypothetical protein